MQSTASPRSIDDVVLKLRSSLNDIPPYDPNQARVIMQQCSDVNVLVQSLKQQQNLPRTDDNINMFSDTMNVLTQQMQEQQQTLRSLSERVPAGSDVGTQQPQQEPTELLHRIRDVEQKISIMNEQLQVVLTKGTQDDAFRQGLLEDVRFEIEKRLGDMESSAKVEQDEPKSDGQKPEANPDAKADGKVIMGDLDEVVFEESIWDAAVVIGWRGIPIISSVSIVILILINIWGQLMFCIIIDGQFTSSSLPSVDRMVFWRANAHSDVNADPISGASLVTRVCNQDDSLQVADSQVAVVANAEAYETDACLLFCGGSGPITFVLAWLLWAMVALADAAANANLFCAVFNRPRGLRTRVDRTEEGLEIVEMSWGRVVIVAILCAVRLAVCTMLFLFGTMWLAYTVNIQNLVLNASALAFVLDMDNCLFEVFMPPVVKGFLLAVKPPKVPFGTPGTHWHFLMYNIGLRPILASIALVGTLVWTWSRQIEEVRSDLQELKTTLCGGDTDFIWRNNMDLHVNLATTSASYVASISDLPGFKAHLMYGAQQLWNRTVGYHSAAGKLIDWDIWLTPNLEVYSLLTETPLQELTYSVFGNYDCDTSHDKTFSEMNLGSFTIGALRKVSNNHDANRCSDISSACGNSDATNLRMFCPTQCGCALARSGLYLAGAAQGCPRNRCVQMVPYQTDMATLSCSDPSVDELSGIPGWNRYWKEFEIVQNEGVGKIFSISDMDGKYLNASGIAAAAVRLGCASLRGKEAINFFCFETLYHSSIVAFCPVTCGCRMLPYFPGCPKNCQAYDLAYQDSMKQLPCEDVPSGAMTVEGNPFANWMAAAALRYENWYYNGDVMGNKLPSHFKHMSMMDFWSHVNTHGCQSLPHSMCHADYGAYHLLTICSEFCNCSQGTSDYCPSNCTSLKSPSP